MPGVVVACALDMPHTSAHSPARAYDPKPDVLSAWATLWICRCLNSKALSCGCLAGVYEMFSGRVVTVVDTVGRACSAHVPGQIVRDTPTPNLLGPLS